MGCVLTKHKQSVSGIDMSVYETECYGYPDMFTARENAKEKPSRLNRWNYRDEVRHPGVDHPSVQRVIKVCGI